MLLCFLFGWSYLNSAESLQRFDIEPAPRCLSVSEAEAFRCSSLRGEQTRDTGGTCWLFGCDDRRMSKCVDHHCVCNEGACALNGACSVPRPCACDTGQSCPGGSCPDSLGAAQCIDGGCECMEGHCFDHATGRCLPNLAEAAQQEEEARDFFLPDAPCEPETGFHCISACGWKRGPAQCVDHRCKCRRGFCSQDGKCLLAVRAREMNHSVDDGSVVAEVYPVHEPARPTFPAPHNEVATALCFSGGGSRSLSTTLGALRALEDLDLMAGVDALSGVSGGTWATAAYMFANFTTEALLRTGHREQPGNLTMERLRDMASTPKLGQAATTTMDTLVKRLALVRPPPEDIWREFIATTILEPLGLDTRTKMMAGSQRQVDDILANNPFLRNSSFQIPMPNRPKVYVMGATILAPVGFEQQSQGIASLQISPDVTGTPFFPRNQTTRYNSTAHDGEYQDMWVGGGFVETFAFGGEAPYVQDGSGLQRMLMPGQVFSLPDAVGMSSAAFAAQMASFTSLPIAGSAANMAPEVLLWPLLRAGEPRQEAHYFRIGDGGNSENGGLLAMLQRDATKIVYFLNTDTPIASVADFDFCNASLRSTSSPVGHVTNQLYDKFGYGTDDALAGFLSHNHVFAQSDLWDLVCDLQQLRVSGRPAVKNMTHTVLRNEWWGLPGGNSVDVLWVYNDRCRDFEELLPADTQDSLRGGGPFDRFPNYKTVEQAMPEFTALTAAQINLLAAQAEYIVHSQSVLFTEFFGGGAGAPSTSHMSTEVSA